MPYSINGVGTSFYGESNYRHEDTSITGDKEISFVTTEWVIVLWIPLIPIRSRRVIKGFHEGFPFPFGTTHYYDLGRAPFAWNKIGQTYLIILGVAVGVALLWSAGEAMRS
jgi:hypothetical protein